MRAIIIVLLGLMPLCAIAKGAEDMYIMWTHPSYKQYYIYEQTINKQRGGTPFAFVYDVTYADSSQAVTYHFSITEPKMVTLDSIAFIVGDKQITYPTPTQFYVDKVKRGWLQRYELSVLLRDWESMYQPDMPLVVVAYTPEGEVNYRVHSAAKWKKTCRRMQQIFDIIALNKTF